MWHADQTRTTQSATLLSRTAWTLVVLAGGWGTLSAAADDDIEGIITVASQASASCDGPNMEFSLAACNDGMTDLENVSIKDTLPPGLLFIEGTIIGSVVDADGFETPIALDLCEPTNGKKVRICLDAPLAPASCVNVTFLAEVVQPMCNKVEVKGNTGDGQPNGETAETKTKVKNCLTDFVNDALTCACDTVPTGASLIESACGLTPGSCTTTFDECTMTIDLLVEDFFIDECINCCPNDPSCGCLFTGSGG